MKKQRGFTLIELLVSISIIAILTALLTANFVGARQRGRDGQRKANLYNIQSALELYRSDNGIYPLDSAFPACGTCLSATGTCDPNDVIYMKEVPCDPSTQAAYAYTSADGLTYTIVACLENEQDSEKDASTGSTCSDASFTLTNP